MLFNSYAFLIFFPCVLFVYYGLSHRWQNRMLLVASYIFYGWWDWRFTLLLLLSTAVDFVSGLRIASSKDARHRRFWLLLSLFTNLGALAFFKYFNFFQESLGTLLESMGLQVSTPILKVILPIGISFYTFQTLSYTIDVYRGLLTPVRDLTAFALYVSYFPQLVAGPIERAAHLLPAIQSPRVVTRAMFDTGCRLILLGFLKKVGIADNLATHIDPCFEDPTRFSPLALTLAVYLFAIQIYCDFSGYSDIARGVSRLLGIDLMVNFRQPYLAASITDFWRRWHISLSSWLRDYLYIPLGGNRHGTTATYRNLMITMLLGGLWHGASWTFVVWGFLHGFYLASARFWRSSRQPPKGSATHRTTSRLSLLMGILITWHLVCLAWIFFRADGISDAFQFLMALVSPQATGLWLERLVLFLFYGAIILSIDISCYRSDSEFPEIDSWPAWSRGLVYAGMITLISFVGESQVVPFIYFQF